MPTKLGSVFGEQIFASNTKRKIIMDTANEESSVQVVRIWLMVLILFLGFSILVLRLFFLTIIEGSKYRQAALQNRIRETKLTAPRGIVYDRNGTALMRNIPTFKLTDGEIFFESIPASISGEYTESIAREYIYGDLFSHVLGYTGEAGAEEIRGQGSGVNKLEMGDVVGKMGLEKSYNEVLRGKNGKMLYEVDALETRVRVLGKMNPSPGRNLTTTLDINLQKKAQEGLKDKKGAVVATVPSTGEVLILYSSPSFDANKLVRSEGFNEVLKDVREPMFNRAIAGLYPPGSTFKIVTAISALESGTVTKDTKIEDTGVLKIGDYSYGNWYFSQYGKKEGMLDIVSAIKRSNDIFFYKAGEAVGIDRLAGWAKKVGVGTSLGIDIGGEEKGLMPDPAWRLMEKGEKWYLGDTYHAAIGQGYVLTTPLQVTAWTNVIASGGKLCRPHIAKIQNSEFSLPAGEAGIKNDQCKDLEIKQETIQLIKEGMKQACSPGGTGSPLFNFKVPASPAGRQSAKIKVDGIDFFPASEATPSGKNWVEIPTACKTGTSEFGDPQGRTHAWFTVFAPVVNPQISITVLVEGGGEGNSVAAPIAKKILEEWFSGK